MLESIALAVKAGLAAVILLALAHLTLGSKRKLLELLIGGGLLGAIAAAGLMLTNQRELVDVIIDAGILVVTILLSISSFTRRQKLAGLMVFAAGILAVARGSYKFLLYPRQIFVQTTSLFNTDLALLALGGSIGLMLLALLFLALVKTGEKTAVNWSKFFLYAWLVMTIEPAVQTLRYLFVSGILPLTDLVMAILIPLINNMAYFSYSIYSVVAAFSLMAMLQYKKHTPQGEFAHPAEARKYRAKKLLYRRWIVAVVSLVAVSGSVLAGNYVLANQKVELSPAVAVEVVDGQVIIPRKDMEDGALHRFAYTGSDGAKVRIIALHKGSGMYGIGLDACDICGVTGYYQRKDEVVCLNCDVVISTPTIGFPGGCNPVPIKYQKSETEILIPVKNLEEKAEKFSW